MKGQILLNALVFVTTFGVWRFIRELHYRFVNYCHERRLGVETSGMVRLSDLGIQDREFVEYTPIGYSAIYSILNRIPLPATDVSFLDYGSGKGRAIVVAATFPFKKVLGVEISEDLNRIAKANIEAMRHRKAGIVEVVHCNAAEFVIPDDVNLIYFFNPFLGATLERVTRNIFASINAHPRAIYVIFFNKIHFEQLVKDAGYRRIKPTHVAHFYPNYSCATYEIAQKDATEPDSSHG